MLFSTLSGCIKNDGPDESMSFEFTLIDGSTKNINEYRGKIVLIDFFGVYCKPCQYQMIVLKEIYDEYKSNEFEIISIDAWISLGETTNLIEQFLSDAEEQGLSFNWIFGADDESGTLYDKYANEGVPMLYLLDRNGNIYYTKAGYTEYSVLVDKIEELI